MSTYQRPQAGAASKAQLVPPYNYRVLCTKASAHVGKESGEPGVKCELQILSPESVQDANGFTAMTAGISGDLYLSFSDKAIATTMDVFAKLEVPLPEAASTKEEDVKLMQDAAVAHLTGLTWEMEVHSKRDVRKGPDKKPLLDSLGRPIQGSEQADFNSFGIVGIPKSLADAGGAASAF